jgi:hypothetical protein
MTLRAEEGFYIQQWGERPWAKLRVAGEYVRLAMGCSDLKANGWSSG